jgi:predicted ATP-dependent serine protease
MFNEATRTRCGHTFCKRCIEKKITDKGHCPTCAKPLTFEQLIEAKSIQSVVKEFKVAKEEFERVCKLDLTQVPIQYLPKSAQQPVSNCKYK